METMKWIKLETRQRQKIIVGLVMAQNRTRKLVVIHAMTCGLLID